jgi:transposase
MKNIIEIPNGAQMLLGLSFDPDTLFEERLTADHRGFLAFLRVVEEHLPTMATAQSRFGRPRYDDVPFLRAYLAKHIYQIDKIELLQQRLQSDSNLRRICGFSRIPSEATFSRRLDCFSRIHLPEAMLARLVRQFYEGELVRVIARDSTSIRAQEKAYNKKKAVKIKKHKCGLPRKDEVRQTPGPRRVLRQLRQGPGKSLFELDKQCSWGCKKSSQGKVQCTKGYTLHLDVTD